MIRRVLAGVGLVLVLGVPGALVIQKERLLARGTSMLLRLAPVDPRSLIQGDYMRLDYAISRDLPGDWPDDGRLVVTLDLQGVARMVRRHEPDRPLAPGEYLLRYRRRSGRMRVGTDAYYFQEGQAARFEGARYGEVRVSASGDALLVGLRDAQRAPLGQK